MRTRVVLIGCGKAKRAERSPARELYTGGLFRDRLTYAEAGAAHAPWWILSAKAGLVRGDQALDPYDLKLADLKPVDRAAWVTSVALALLTELGDDAVLRDVLVEVHAGEDYAGPLLEVLRALGFSVSRPVEGLGIGEQRAWYRAARSMVEVGMFPPIARPGRSSGNAGSVAVTTEDQAGDEEAA